MEKPPAKDKAKESEVLNTEKEKKRIARQKERRATLILGEHSVLQLGMLIKCVTVFERFFFFNYMDFYNILEFGIPLSLCLNQGLSNNLLFQFLPFSVNFGACFAGFRLYVYFHTCF